MSKKDAKKLDKLTGVLNHDAFVTGIDEQVSSASEESRCVSLAMIDIDWFKKINDEHGHLAGDELLITIAKFLHGNLGDSGDVYRYAGDEFTILMPGIQKEQAFLQIEKARAEFWDNQEIVYGGKILGDKVSLSIGIATFPDDGARSQEILRKAGDAMHRAKSGGRNQVCIAREEKMVTKTSHYTQGQLERLSELAKQEGVGEAILLREALDDVFRKYKL